MPKLRPTDLAVQYPPSEPCACPVCLAYCARPGWWTVREAGAAIAAGHAERMMLELSPERSVAVVSPAFKGCERFFALQERSSGGCTFLMEQRCQLHGTGLMPLECRFCHHERAGEGPRCHADLEHDWNTPAGRQLVATWMRQVGLWPMRHLTRIPWLVKAR